MAGDRVHPQGRFPGASFAKEPQGYLRPLQPEGFRNGIQQGLQNGIKEAGQRFQAHDVPVRKTKIVFFLALQKLISPMSSSGILLSWSVKGSPHDLTC